MAVLRPVLLAAALLAVLAVAGGQLRGHGAAAASTGLTPAQRAAGLRFAPGTAPLDAQAVRAAIARARPEARRLIDAVDGAVTVTVRATGVGQAVGTTQPGPDGFTVILDLGTVSRWYGERGITRLVLHELGHVVDLALATPALREQLDGAIPPGYPCGGRDAACAGRSDREERFAETFAKWATGDIGVGLDIGYRVPPPASLGGWGAPLAAVG